MSVIPMFRVTRVKNEVKEYWNGSESPYSSGNGCWVNEIGAYYTWDPGPLQKKVNKKKRQMQAQATQIQLNHPVEYVREAAQAKLSTFDGAYIEQVNVQVIGEIPLDESL